jgi:bacteriorhodopsin
MLYQSAILSLIIQIIVLFVDIFGLTIPIQKDKLLFNQLLKMEFGVQIVELIFYVWMIFNFSSIDNITPKRYYDWIITTPIMIITLMAYLDSRQFYDIFAFISANKNILIKVVLANLAMLLFGLLGEYGVIDYNIAILMGFIPFIYYFYLIYQNYINNKKPTNDKKIVFLFFFIIWSIYGLSAFFPYILKNTAYNILDLFAKNLFGVFLVYLIWTFRIKK